MGVSLDKKLEILSVKKITFPSLQDPIKINKKLLKLKLIMFSVNF